MILKFLTNIKDRLIICLALGIFILLTIGLINAWITPCSGYEADIYSETPLLFWISIFSGYIVGILYILFNLFRDGNSLLKYIGFTLLIISAISLASLCIIRGYNTLYISGDTGTHIGVINDIITSGLLPDTYYPGIYADTSILQIITSINIFDLLSLYYVYLLGVFILGIYLLSREIFPNNRVVSLIAIISLMLPFGTVMIVGMHPVFGGMTIPKFLFPILMYAMLKLLHGSNKLYLIVTIFIVSLLFYHPIVTLSFILFLISLLIVYWIPIYNKINNQHKFLKKIFLILIITIGGFIYLQWSRFGDNILSSVRSLLSDTEIGNTEIGKSIELISLATDYGYPISTYFRISSINICIYILVILALIIYLRYHVKNHYYFNLRVLFTYAILLVLTTVFLAFSITNFGYTRFMGQILLLSIIFAGYAIYYISINLTSKHSNILSHKRMIAIFVILVIICSLSIMSYHASPFTLNTGYQTTGSELYGIETMLPNLNSELSIVGITQLTPWRYATLFYGPSIMLSNQYGDQLLISKKASDQKSIDSAPIHFNYDNNDLFGMYYDNEVYLQIVTKDYEIYTVYFPNLEKDRWGQLDFIHLENDISVNKLYSNNGYMIYFVT